MDTKVIYKDYFTEEEAADYCGVSYSQFRNKASEVGIQQGRFMGKIVYRRTDLQRAIEREAFKWPHTTNTTGRGISNGRTRKARGIKNALVEHQSSPNEKRN